VLQQPAYKLIRLRNGTHSVHSVADAETFHPGIGPVAEAEALYVRQLQLCERVERTADEFVIWDVGLGAAANALTAIRLIREHLRARSTAERNPKRIRIVSFDQTRDAAEFALQHAAELEYVPGYEALLASLLKEGRAELADEFIRLEWFLELGDFPTLLSGTDERAKSFREKVQSGLLLPHAILFDPHSPKKNPAMWTVSLFSNLFRLLQPSRPCALANFTRSTMARAAMLLGGFFVGVGHASGLKEETTVAANSLELISEPLDARWLERAKRSDSAEPLSEPVYRRTRLGGETLARLEKHPQFCR
jgi:tRNA U34 5-methylaminomethyl-2-thiouridine-forming methyltransferase MnmC